MRNSCSRNVCVLKLSRAKSQAQELAGQRVRLASIGLNYVLSSTTGKENKERNEKEKERVRERHQAQNGIERLAGPSALGLFCSEGIRLLFRNRPCNDEVFQPSSKCTRGEGTNACPTTSAFCILPYTLGVDEAGPHGCLCSMEERGRAEDCRTQVRIAVLYS